MARAWPLGAPGALPVSPPRAQLAPLLGLGVWAVGTPSALAPHPLPFSLSPQKFDELLHLASRGQHANVDMLVQDIYGGAHQTLGLSGNLIASSFGKSATADRGSTVAGSPPALARCTLWLLARSTLPTAVSPQSSPRRTWPRACCT